MLVPVCLFIVGLILLIKGGDWFVDGASGIAREMHIPELLIGATVVSIGTTLPEVLVSATASLGGHGEIAYGNAIGSIICNTALISAITITVAPSKIEKKSLYTPVFFFYLAAIIYATVAYTSSFTRAIGIVLLSLFVIYMLTLVIQMRKEMKNAGNNPTLNDASTENNLEVEDDKKNSKGKNLIMLIGGAAVIAVGANLLVDNGIIIAKGLGVPESVIGLTFVALGTSLPELVTAVTSLIKGHGALSLGNIIGANLFNLVLVSGISITLSPFDVPQSNTLFGINSSLVLDIPVMFIVMSLMIFPALLRGKLSRIQGILLLCIYTGFTIFQFVM